MKDLIKNLNQNEPDNLEINEDHLKDLNLRTSNFLRAWFLNGFNGTQAAITAGYKAKYATNQASKMLRSPPVIAAIEKIKADIAKSTEYTSTKCVNEMDYFIRESHRLKQMNAVASLLKIKAQITGHLVDNMNINLNQRGHLNIQIGGSIAPPPYALEGQEPAKDVTPPKIEASQPQSIDVTALPVGLPIGRKKSE